MRILIVTPAPPRSRHGNRVTALRWALILRRLGHRVVVACDYTGQPADALVALHARKSYASIKRWRRRRAGAPLIVALTGTDLYGDIHRNRMARRSLEWAWRLIVLQPMGLRELPRRYRLKTWVIYQSVGNIRKRRASPSGFFDVGVLAHLRPVKDPWRAALATRLLPPTSRIRILHAGRALSEAMRRRAQTEMRTNPKFRWLGELTRSKALQCLGGCRLLAVTSRLEGGANVVSEAIAAGVPVVSSRIAGSIGLLGRDYPGYFRAGDERALAKLLRRAESDAAFYDRLRRHCIKLRPLIDPARERKCWRSLLGELSR